MKRIDFEPFHLFINRSSHLGMRQQLFLQSDVKRQQSIRRSATQVKEQMSSLEDIICIAMQSDTVRI